MTKAFQRTRIDPSNVAITGGTINGATIGATTAATGKFTTVSLSGDIFYSISGSGVQFRAGDVVSFYDIDFNDVTTAEAVVRYHRATNTTGGWAVTYHKGDGSSLVQHEFQDDGRDSFVCLQGGDFGIGLSNPTEKLEVVGNIKTSGVNGSSIGLRTVSTELTALTGASVTATNLIPAGSFIIGITTRVTTTITGATSFTIGDGVDVDRWGTGIALTAGTTTDITDFTAAGFGQFATANDVVLTATGPNFTAGAVRIVVNFFDLTAATS